MSLTSTMTPAASWDISNRDRSFAPHYTHRVKLSSATATATKIRPAKGRNSSKQLQQLEILYNEAKSLFHQSALSRSFQIMLQAKSRPRVTKVVSLGLGSLGPSKDQTRRIKQLVIFINIASYLDASSSETDAVALYAQDPNFTKTDEEFLGSLGIRVLKTPSASDLGEAGSMIDGETIVYSPFLTIDAYIQLFAPLSAKSRDVSGPGAVLPALIGDDFNALKMKWEKRTAEHRQVDEIMKEIKASEYQRRAVGGGGFWEDADSPFPMAFYLRQSSAGQRVLAGDQRTKVAAKPRRQKL